MSIDDTGPMLLTYMPTSMTVGFTAKDKGEEWGTSDWRWEGFQRAKWAVPVRNQIKSERGETWLFKSRQLKQSSLSASWLVTMATNGISTWCLATFFLPVPVGLLKEKKTRRWTDQLKLVLADARTDMHLDTNTNTHISPRWGWIHLYGSQWLRSFKSQSRCSMSTFSFYTKTDVVNLLHLKRSLIPLRTLCFFLIGSRENGHWGEGCTSLVPPLKHLKMI